MNYEIMKQSENELHAEFIKFCDHVLETWQTVVKWMKTNKVSSKELEQIHKLEELSNHFEAQIQDDCIWSISKNEPLANHLRYVIAILNSIKDLERMADYAVSATRFMMNNKVSDEILRLIIDSAKAAISAISKVFKALTTKTALDTYKISQAAHVAFKKEYNEMLERLSGILKKRSAEQIERLFQGAIIIIKHTERLVDHVDNICENFVFIKQSDFFFTKQSKQWNKK